MDEFKRVSFTGKAHIGPGGIKCSCCWVFPPKDRKKYRKMLRSVLKRNLRMEIE